MAYGLSTRAFIEGGPAGQAVEGESARPTARSWRGMSAACRLAAVEQAVRADNDRIDAFPLAL